MFPFVSIITPCYNGANYIASCITSVQAQTFTNWEMLIIDDCSTDNTAEIINQFCQKDHRIKYYKTEEPSGSPAHPRNIGIEHACGLYVAFLDSDDMWLHTKLETQISFIMQQGFSFVYSDYEKMSSTGVRNNRIIRVKKRTSYNDALKSCSIPCLTAMVKRAIIEDIKFKNEPKEDYIFWLALLKKGYIAYNTNTVEAIYRVSANSRSGDKIKMIKYQWYVLRKIEHVNIFRSIVCMLFFVIVGFYKYIQ